MALDPDILTIGEVRIFIQKDGVGPNTDYEYMGRIQLDGTAAGQGEPAPIFLPSTQQRNAWDIVGIVPTNQELGSADFTQDMDRFLGDIWWDLKRTRCTFPIQALIGKCSRPDSFFEWDAKIIIDSARLTNLALPTFNPLTGDDNAHAQLTGSMSFIDMLPVKAIRFAEVAAATLVAEALDGVYNDDPSCGDCGTPSDGCQIAYVLTGANTGSPGLSSQVLVTLDGGSTWTAVDIDTLGGLSGNRLAVVGDKVVVVSAADQSHHYITVTDLNTGTANWTEQGTGYVTGPRAIYSKSAQETFVAAQGGYIYKMTNPTAAVTVLTDGSLTTQQQNDIHGRGRVVVSVGASNTVLFSANAGDTFSLVTGPAVGVNLTAIWVQTSQLWFVGDGAGNLYYTLDQGANWTEVVVAADLTVINDIQFANSHVGYVSGQAGLVGRVYRTTDGGRTWDNAAPSIASLPTNERVNFTVPCFENEVLAGGRVSAGGDGMLAIAS